MRTTVIVVISIAVAYGVFIATENAMLLFWRNPTPIPAWKPGFVAFGVASIALFACNVVLRRAWRSRAA